MNYKNIYKNLGFSIKNVNNIKCNIISFTWYIEFLKNQLTITHDQNLVLKIMLKSFS